MEMDERDRMILRLLQKDGRISNAELAEKVNLSASACLRRVRLLEEAGFIDHYTMLLNPARIGKPGNAFVNIAITRQTREALETFEKEIQKVPEVVECYLLAGQSDYLVHVVYSDTGDYERIHSEVLTQLPGVERVQTVITLREVKRTTELPV
jgi:DNA-binding Lrp family transcriptional regulator